MAESRRLNENNVKTIRLGPTNREETRYTVDPQIDESNNRTVEANIFEKVFPFLQTRLQFTQGFCVLITVVELILFGIDQIFRSNHEYSVVSQSLLVDADKPVWHIWRFFTYILVHQTFGHIAYNLAYQLVFGMLLELGGGWWPICLIYFGGAAAGSLMVFCFSSFKNLVGCSGGTFSIIGATLCCLIRLQNRQSSTSNFNGFFGLVIFVVLAVTFTREICAPEVVPNQFILPLYESSVCRINTELSDTMIVHLYGLLWGIITFIVMEYFRSKTM